MLAMNNVSTSLSIRPGQGFRDRDGQRWWVSGPRPDSDDEFIIQAEMKGSYPRVAVYVMTETEFREHAAMADLKAENQASGAAGKERGLGR